jgi:hypothetical protein
MQRWFGLLFRLLRRSAPVLQYTNGNDVQKDLPESTDSAALQEQGGFVQRVRFWRVLRRPLLQVVYRFRQPDDKREMAVSALVVRS